MVIIVIDDSLAVLNLMKKEITCHGHQCVSFNKPLQALIDVENIKPNIVIVDYIMFDMLGTDVCKKILEMDMGCKVILYSALFDKNVPAICESMGIEFIEKKDIKKRLEELFL